MIELVGSELVKRAADRAKRREEENAEIFLCKLCVSA
jgi:hypothetical protein